MRREIGVNQSIGDEVAVVRRVTELSAECEPLRTIGKFLCDAVVFPLPYEAALQTRRVLERLPIVGERTVREEDLTASGCSSLKDATCRVISEAANFF